MWIGHRKERIRSDEGLTLETSASESLYGGQFSLSTQLIKPNYLIFMWIVLHEDSFCHRGKSNTEMAYCIVLLCGIVDALLRPCPH